MVSLKSRFLWNAWILQNFHGLSTNYTFATDVPVALVLDAIHHWALAHPTPERVLRIVVNTTPKKNQIKKALSISDNYIEMIQLIYKTM